jgi:hypothetical protein
MRGRGKRILRQTIIEQLPLVSGDSMNIEKVNYVVHFDVLIEHDVTSLRSDWLSEEQVDDVLSSTQLGLVVKRIEDEDADTYFYGDVDLTDQESYINLLKGRPTISVISAGFDGKLVEPIGNDWLSIRNWMIELRRRIMPAEGRWSAYTEAPVTISLGSMELAQTGFDATYFDLCSKDAIRAFISSVQEYTPTNPAVRDFVEYFGPEIKAFQDGEVSKFLEFWFATELLLTQKELNVIQIGDSYQRLVPVYSSENFDWVRPKNLNMFLEGERSWSPSKVFWYTPVPGNPFREGSDPEWDYSMVTDLEKRVGLNDTTFSKIRFALTMYALQNFVEVDDVDEAFFEVGQFYEQYKLEIGNLVSVMEESFDWDDLIELESEEADFIEHLEFPENALTIWDAYLKTILRSETEAIAGGKQESENTAKASESDFVISITQSNAPDEVVAQKAIEYCKSVLIPKGRHAEAFCVSQVVNRYYFSNLVPSAAFDTANAARSILENSGYTILEPSTFEVRPKGDNPWNYSQNKQTIVEVNVWSALRNSNLSQEVANIPRPINLATEFEIVFDILNGIKSGITEQILEFFKSGLEGQGDIHEIFETGRWLTGYYIHKLIWPGN